MDSKISQQKIQKYMKITQTALAKVKIIAPGSSYISDIAQDFFDMANRYYQDAQHFSEKGDLVNAFAAVNYAHGWLDAGARMGFFDVDEDNRLFTLAH